MKLRVLTAGVVLMAVLACGGGGSDADVPIEALPMGTVLSLDVIDGKKTPTRLSGTTTEPWPWTVPLNFPSGGYSSGGDALFPQRDGSTVYCGMAYMPAITESCWSIAQDGSATPIGPPVFASAEEPGMRRLPAFGSDGSWWQVEADVKFSPSMSKPAQRVPYEGTTRLARWSAEAGRFLRIAGDLDCTLEITKPDGTVEQTQPIRCWAEPRWSPDGSAVAWVSDGGIEVWTLSGSVERVLIRVVAHDGADEQVRLLAWSPDGATLLLKSSRHRNRSYNPCAGIYTTKYWTYVLNLDGSMKRVPDVGLAPTWVK